MPAIQYENRGLLGDHLLKVPYFTASIEKLEIWGNVSHPRNAPTQSTSFAFVESHEHFVYHWLALRMV